ncbi:MAG: hypothetical protein DIU56_010470 [Pseudomonadota bacterium]|jgi:hypothetical protein|nr:MAG: hypothetical protein DIU56_06860 [Pseudomonadota bacterium]
MASLIPTRRTVRAPVLDDARLPPLVESVELGPGEDVLWHWKQTPHGRQITGYTILKPRLQPALLPG